MESFGQAEKVERSLDITLDPRRYTPLPNGFAPPPELFLWAERDAPVLRRCFMRNTEGQQHFLHKTLRGPDGLESGVYYAEPSADDGLVRRIVVVWKLGPGTEGHVGVGHGGLVAALIDDALGCVTHAYSRSAGFTRGAVTGSLTVNYRAPVLVPGTVVCEAKVEHVEGRKVSCVARCFAQTPGKGGGASADTDGVPFLSPDMKPTNDATALFIQLKEASVVEARAQEKGQAAAI